jgi:hypothetical protein
MRQNATIIIFLFFFGYLDKKARLYKAMSKERMHLSFPQKGGRRAAESFQSLFSHTDGIWDGYGEDGRKDGSRY